MNNFEQLKNSIFSNSVSDVYGTGKIGEQVFTINIPPEVLWFLMTIALLFFITMSGIFHYHWKKYSTDENPKIFAKSLYWIVSLLLITIMLFALVGFEYF